MSDIVSRPVFVADEMLTASKLNQLVAYVDQQVALALASAVRAETARREVERAFEAGRAIFLEDE